MTKRLLFSDLVSKASELHGNKYLYLSQESRSVGSSGNFLYVNYVCSSHGLVSQRQDSHLRGQGCKACASSALPQRQPKPFEVFAKQAVLKLPGYTFIGYSGKGLYKAVCPEGHSYVGRCNNTLTHGTGCNICKVGKHNFETSTARAVEVHGGKYAYTGLATSKGKAVLSFTCPEHGPQQQSLEVHLRGSGCRKCAIRHRNQSTILPVEVFKASSAYKNSGLVLVDGTYLRSALRASFICAKGHQSEKPPAAILNRGDSCRFCSNTVSSQNVEIADFMNARGAEALLEQKVGNLNVDVWSSRLNLAVDFHGLIWHSSRFRKDAESLKRDYYRWIDLTGLGIRNIQLFQDEWQSRRAACEVLLGHLTNSLPKLGARKLKVRRVSKEDSLAFLEVNHIQGAPLDLNNAYGLYSGDDLYSVGVFTQRLTKRGQKPVQGIWELTRFASKASVQGAFGKVFHHFIREHGPESVVTYSDNRLFTGKMYGQNGFVKTHACYPDYYYFKNSKSPQRLHKSRLQKSRLQKLAPAGSTLDLSKTEKELTEQLGYFRVYDCGKTAWKWTKPNT